MLIIFFSYFSTHNLNRVHFTLCLLVSGKDHAEELSDVEVESMYPLVFSTASGALVVGGVRDISQPSHPSGDSF